MTKKSVYQSEEYKKSLGDSKVIDISKDFFALERKISFLFIKFRILEARGTPNKSDLKAFKEMASEYFYGTIAPTVVNHKEDYFKGQGFNKVSNSTILIDLKKSEEELFKATDKGSIRWGVNAAKRNGLVFVKAEQSELEDFYLMYEKTARDGGFKPENMRFIEKTADSDISKLFFVKKDGKIVAGGLILIDKENKYSILDLTSATEEGLKLQAMPFLYWNLLLYSKNEGLLYFDLGGYDSEARGGDKTYNINKFKERFGGKIVEQPIYSTNWKYPLIRRLMRKIRILKGGYGKE